MKTYKKIIIAFYASSRRPSEYRSGAEFIRFAGGLGFDLAVIADLADNDDQSHFTDYAPGIDIVRVPSPLKAQASFYKYGDFVAQLIWQRRAAKWIRQHAADAEVIWILNGAQPWFPIKNYFLAHNKVIWGPIGGGALPPPALLAKMSRSAAFREHVRGWLEALSFVLLRRNLKHIAPDRLIAFARTSEAQRRLKSKIPGLDAPIIPEILVPLKSREIARSPQQAPRFLWVGQDVPRKNLPLALDIFARLRQAHFPEATLDIYGCDRSSAPPGVVYHGWVPRIDWDSYRDQGVLLLTSYREGLPSVILEAISAGLLCVTSDTGALASLRLDSLYVMPAADYPVVSEPIIDVVGEKVRAHLAKATVSIPLLDFRQDLVQHLDQHGLL